MKVTKEELIRLSLIKWRLNKSPATFHSLVRFAVFGDPLKNFEDWACLFGVSSLELVSWLGETETPSQMTQKRVILVLREYYRGK